MIYIGVLVFSIMAGDHVDFLEDFGLVQHG